MSSRALVAAPSRGKLAVRLAVDLSVVLLFALLIASSMQRYLATSDPGVLGSIAVNGIITALFITRREAGTVATHPATWLVSIGGTVTPLLMRAAGSPPLWLASFGNAVQFLGLGLIVLALLSLRRSFGIVPANRGVQTGGLYQFVRHPLYGAELTSFIGFALAHPTVWNFSLLAIELALQWVRVQREEELLSQDRAYQAYQEQVRFRLLPGLL